MILPTEKILYTIIILFCIINLGFVWYVVKNRTYKGKNKANMNGFKGEKVTNVVVQDKKLEEQVKKK